MGRFNLLLHVSGGKTKVNVLSDFGPATDAHEPNEQ